MFFYRRPGFHGDERCLGTDIPASYIVQIDEYVAFLPQTAALREEGYIHLDRDAPLPGKLVAFAAVEPWLPNCGKISLPDGRTFQVRNHEVWEVA